MCKCMCEHIPWFENIYLSIQETSDFHLLMQLIRIMECRCTSQLCMRVYVVCPWKGSLAHSGEEYISCSFGLISLRSIPEVFKKMPKVIISPPPCSFSTFCGREWQPV